MREVHPPDRRRLLLLLRSPQHGVRPGVELGSGPCDSVRVGGFRDLLRHSRSGGEATEAEGLVAGKSVVDPPRDARGKLHYYCL